MNFGKSRSQAVVTEVGQRPPPGEHVDGPWTHGRPGGRHGSSSELAGLHVDTDTQTLALHHTLTAPLA